MRNMQKNGFSVLKTNNRSHARRGQIVTSHGAIETPAFVPDATYGVIKHISISELKAINLPMVLGNTYHLSIRPGTEVIEHLGGLHQFMNWNKPIITDSGGYQVFSLVFSKKMGRVYDNYIEFKDHVTGAKHMLTPETSIEIQLKLDSDILMVLDYPVEPEVDNRTNQYSVERTTAWAEKALKTFQQFHPSQEKLLWAIIQGANDMDLRRQSFNELYNLGFQGFAFGGPPEDDDIVAETAELIPHESIRYMMGAGRPQDIRKFVEMGYDLFDCVVPTRNARHGLLYTSQGEVRIDRAEYSLDTQPIDSNCDCIACITYTRAYLHHLFKINEPLGQRLATTHNLTFYMKMMEKIRDSI